MDLINEYKNGLFPQYTTFNIIYTFYEYQKYSTSLTYDQI